jgi:hypothetical protein
MIFFFAGFWNNKGVKEMLNKLSAFVKTLVILSFVLDVAPQAYAEESILGDSLKDISTVGAMGAGGAVLGLSTLSFVDEPKDHLKNILVGGALGIIIGVGVVAWFQASKSTDMYQGSKSSPRAPLEPTFPGSERYGWHKDSSVKLVELARNNAFSQLNLHFSF